jgi:hypothetical protein
MNLPNIQKLFTSKLMVNPISISKKPRTIKISDDYVNKEKKLIYLLHLLFFIVFLLILSYRKDSKKILRQKILLKN